MDNLNSEVLTNNFSNLLLEVGVEEIPARFLPGALFNLEIIAKNVLEEYRLPFKNIKTFATPRRLALIAEIGKLQKALEKEFFGPPVNVAYDEFGNPTKAAEAFAKSHGLSVDHLQKREKGKGLYVVAKVLESPKDSREVLPEVLSKIILSLNFPKNMRWGDGDLRFVRPIHWILAIFDNETVSFKIDGIESNKITKGHRFLSPAAFEIKDVRSYINLLKNNFVILDQEERKRIILEESKKLAQSVNASVILDEELLEHITFLVEYPVLVLGTFSSEYLSLPRELLITVMKGHQKYIALEDSHKRLINYFIVVSNTKSINAETVRRGAERVIKARFEDARFYFEEDTKLPLLKRLEGLKNVVFHEKLGSLYDKTERIKVIASYMADRVCPYKKEEVVTAVLLSKTDLITGVVREFPELQGIIGSYYAQKEGYSNSISKALREQYIPQHPGDALPETDIGAIISIADKIDNITSFFMIGLSPTGSEDPFALRRQSHGVILITLGKRYDITIEELLNVSLQNFDLKEKSELFNTLIKFFEQRIEYIFQSEGYKTDLIASVIPLVTAFPLYRIKERIDALLQFREDPDYDAVMLAIKRVNNIAPKQEMPPLKTDLLMQSEEKSLYHELQRVSKEVQSFLKEHQYFSALITLKDLKDPINMFFDKVLVMDKREELKLNRLSLIKDLQRLIQQVADFSKLS